MAATAGFTRDIGREYRRVRLIAREDPMLAMTIGAHGSLSDAAGNGFTVNTFTICSEHIGVTAAARLGNICARNLRRRIARGQDRMRAVAIGASSTAVSRRYIARMDALQIRFHRPNQRNTKFLGQLRVRMAHGASLSNIFRVHRRAWIGAGNELMNIAVAARAGWWFLKTLRARLGVNALGIRFDRRSVAGIALNRLELGLMRYLRNVSVTGCAVKRAMNGFPKRLGFDLQGNFLPLTNLFQSRCAVAAKTSFFGDRLRL